jgi:hypothetical protein
LLGIIDPRVKPEQQESYDYLCELRAGTLI